MVRVIWDNEIIMRAHTNDVDRRLLRVCRGQHVTCMSRTARYVYVEGSTLRVSCGQHVTCMLRTARYVYVDDSTLRVC